LDFGENESSYFALVGNPFMTTIDFEKLAEDNNTSINSYLIWTREGFSGYSKSGTFGTITATDDLTKYIAPLQSFIVERTDESSVKFDFNI
jgi:hypothetical protein